MAVNQMFLLLLSTLINSITANPTVHLYDSDQLPRQLIIGGAIFVIVLSAALLICNVTTCRDVFKYVCLTLLAFVTTSGLVFIIVFGIVTLFNEHY